MVSNRVDRSPANPIVQISDTPLDYVLHAAGPAALPTLKLAWALLALCAVVAVVVTALLIGAIFRKRAKHAPRDLHADAGGMRWVWIGTGISTAGIMATLVYMLVILETVARPSTPPRLVIDVTAYDWWWKLDYADRAHPGTRVVTANEIHIPTGESVRIVLHSADVIHAFWVPQLAGKTQAIPGITNEQWIEADAAGTYRGQCTQFCGAQHAHMAFEVVAQSRDAFDAWYAAQSSDAHALSDTTASAGQKLFGERCAGCHTIRGTDAAGVQAPDLTHLASRRLIAAGTLVNTDANALDWIRHAQQIKPDSLMPSIALDPQEATALVAYLKSLQ